MKIKLDSFKETRDGATRFNLLLVDDGGRAIAALVGLYVRNGVIYPPSVRYGGNKYFPTMFLSEEILKMVAAALPEELRAGLNENWKKVSWPALLDTGRATNLLPAVMEAVERGEEL